MQVGPLGTLYYSPLKFSLPHVLPQCHQDFMRLKKGRDKSDDIAKPFAKLPFPITLLLLCELTHIATCDTSTTGKFCKIVMRFAIHIQTQNVMRRITQACDFL